jgi:membrane protease YdiL (CAAX protease family)
MAVAEMTITEPKARKRGLGLFFTLTFALTWGIAALFVFAPDLVGEAGLSNPLYVVAVWSPAISGIVLAWHRLGRRGLRGFFSRLTMIRMPLSNWLFLVVGIPVIVYAGAALSGTLDTTPVFSPWYSAVPALLAAMFLAGTVEEIGWRGVALPILQRRCTPLTSGLLVGLAWALWHLPAFALSGTVQSGWAFGPYFAGLMAVSVIMTWFFNASNGSILVAWLVHFQAMNPLFADGQPWDSLMYVIAAVVIVIVNRKSMLRRGGDAVVELQRPVTSERDTAVGGGVEPRVATASRDVA